MQKKTKQRIIGVSAVAGAALLTVAPYVGVRIAYSKAFCHHINTYEPLYFSQSDFPKLNKEKHIFKSDDHNLTGYMYFYEDISKDGVIIFSHGYGGGGHKCYLDCINYLAKSGFYVFGYDASGNDESEGEMKGFPQGIIDVLSAIKYVSSLKAYKEYPLMLFGHSWGAYSVSNALNYVRNIKAIVSMSGFNKSTSLIKERGHIYSAGNEMALMPYVDGYEHEVFKEYSKSEAIKGFRNVDTKVYIVHSGDDLTVPISTGYTLYYNEFKDDPRFKFALFEDRGHGTVYYSKEGVNYTNEFYKKYNEFLKSNPNDEQKQEFIKENIDRNIWNNRINKELFENIVGFYKDSIK